MGDPILGIHRPYLPGTDLSNVSADKAVAAERLNKAMVENYLNEMSVSPKYTEKIFSVPRNEVQWISEKDYEADLDGIIPELRDWIDARGKAVLDEKKQELDEAKQAATGNLLPYQRAFNEHSKAYLEKEVNRLADPNSRQLEVLDQLQDEAKKRMYEMDSNERGRSFCRSYK
jgi:hypothetical protein